MHLKFLAILPCDSSLIVVVIINCDTYFRMMPFADIHISEGSVATCLKCGGIFKHEFVANLLQSLIVKKFENRIIIGEVMAKSLVSCFF